MAAPGETFVGRLHELETLRGTLDQAIGGRGQIVMVAGEPGIGKTGIAQELAHHAEQHGALVLWGHCHEEAGAPPYWPWVQIFRRALGGEHRRTVLADIGIGASDIADILPEIHDLAPGLEPSARLEDAAQARFRMFESIRQFVASLNRDRTVMLVLDDLHWADTPSLRLLEFLAPALADSRLLLVGTYRANELSRQHPLSDALGGLARVPHATRIHLAGLTAEEVHEFIAAATGARPPAWLASSLHTQTEGNPLFLREIVQFLEQQGVFRAALAALPPAIRIPEGVKEVIGRRLNLLSGACNEILALASVIGRDFALDLLQHVTGRLGDDSLLDALDEGVAAHVIEETDEGHYQFTHNLIRMTLYDELRARHGAAACIARSARQSRCCIAPMSIRSCLNSHATFMLPATPVARSITRRVRGGVPMRCWPSRTPSSSSRPRSTASSRASRTSWRDAGCCCCWVMRNARSMTIRVHWRPCAKQPRSRRRSARPSCSRAQRWPMSRSPGAVAFLASRRRRRCWNGRCVSFPKSTPRCGPS